MQIGIVGLGLIGGSLAIDLRSQGHRILAASRRASTCETAVKRGMADAASQDFALLSEAEVIFLCPPLGVLQQTVEKLLPHLSPSTILTDVGSVKLSVVEAIAPLWPNFVGGHPMAGTTESGIDAALSGLFQNRAYVLTPIESTPPEAVETVATLARSLQSVVYQCHPADHDRAVAWISHLPVMVSASLIAACQGEANPIVLDLAQKFASSGFRDTSRVGGGNPELGVMMAHYNQSALLDALEQYQTQLAQLTDLVRQSRWEDLNEILTSTQTGRSHFSIPDA